MLYLFKNRIIKLLSLLTAAMFVFVMLPSAAFAEETASEQTYCGLDEHVHSEACFETVKVLACTLEENEEHTHTDDCYIEETRLVCELLEHTHSLICYSNRSADVENATVWQRSVSAAELNGNWAHDVVEIAKTQIGYAASEHNFVVVDGRRMGYTRYGDWYGDTDTYLYGEWCAGFVSFCLHYAGVDALPKSFACAAWVRSLSEIDAYRDAADYAPKAGDLIFFYSGKDADKTNLRSNHVGIVVEITDDEIVTIEGNHGPVGYHRYAKDDPTILGYGVLPDNPNAKPSFEKPAFVSPAAKRFPFARFDARFGKRGDVN